MASRKSNSTVSAGRGRWWTLLGAVLWAGVLVSAAPGADAPKADVAAKEQSEKICQVEVRSYPGRDPAMWDGLYAARNGIVYSALMTEGESAHLYAYDPATDKNELLYDMAEVLGERGKGIRTAGKLHNKPVEDDEGNIYIVTLNNGSGPRNIDSESWPGGHWLRYNPREKKLDDLGLMVKNDGLYPLTIDTKRLHLFGLSFTGYLFRFDVNKRETKNLGRVSNFDVCRDIFCDDEGNVFGSFPPARVWKYDAKTEKVLDLKIFMPFDPTGFPTRMLDPSFDRAYEWRSIEWDPVEKVAYGVTCGSGSILFRFDPHQGPEGKFTSLSRMCDTRFLTPGEDPLGPIRPDIPYSTLAFALDVQRKKVWYAPSARTYSMQSYVETFGSSAAHHLIQYDIQTGERIDLGAMQTAEGRRVFGCEAASVGPDGRLYICGQVEVKDEEKATRYAGNVPVAMHLIIYQP